MSKTDQQREIRLEIRLPQTGYPKAMYFNRLSVEREEGFRVIHFALFSGSGLLLDSYSCVLGDYTVEQNKKTLLEYLGRIGNAKQKISAWQVAPLRGNMDVADIISMAVREDLAETRFCLYSMAAATRSQRTTSGEPVEAQALILPRSPIELQKQLIEALYE